MNREVRWTAPAERDMAKLDETVARRVRAAVSRFAETGQGNVKALTGEFKGLHRLRAADDWRVVMDLRTSTVLAVIRVRHRRDVYR